MCNFHSSLWSLGSVFDNPEGCQVRKQMGAHIQATEGKAWCGSHGSDKAVSQARFHPCSHLQRQGPEQDSFVRMHVVLRSSEKRPRAYMWRGSRGRCTLYFASISSGHREQEVSCSENSSLAAAPCRRVTCVFVCVCVRVVLHCVRLATGDSGWRRRLELVARPEPALSVQQAAARQSSPPSAAPRRGQEALT